MQKLNIIPEKLKKQIKLDKIKEKTDKLFSIILLFVFFYSAVLTISRTILLSHYEETITQASSVTKSTENYVKKVEEINNELNQIIKIQENNVKLSKILNFFQKNNANGKIEYKNIDIDKNKNTVKIIGHAQKRKNLLFLKEKIENNKSFSDLDFPIKNILQQENIDFEISLKINNYKPNES